MGDKVFVPQDVLDDEVVVPMGIHELVMTTEELVDNLNMLDFLNDMMILVFAPEWADSSDVPFHSHNVDHLALEYFEERFGPEWVAEHLKIKWEYKESCYRCNRCIEARTNNTED